MAWQQADKDHPARGRDHPGAGGDRGGAGHAPVLNGDEGELLVQGAQGADLGRRARRCRKQCRRPPCRDQEGGHGRGRAALLAGTGWLPAVLYVPGVTCPVDSGAAGDQAAKPVAMAAE